MKTSIVWKNEMEFDAVSGDHVVRMDAKPPIGKNSGATPKELVAMGLGGCTAMDVIALMKKHKQPLKAFRVEVEIQPSNGAHPIVFDKALLNFVVDGLVDSATLIESVRLSQTKYCGVSAMLSQSFPIEYKITLNGIEIGLGSAQFQT